MENKQLTAVEWLIEQLDSDIRNSLVVQQALELEKQQRKDSYNDGYHDGKNDNWNKNLTYKKPTE